MLLLLLTKFSNQNLTRIITQKRKTRVLPHHHRQNLKRKIHKLNSHFQFNEKEKKERVIGGLLKQFISNSGKRNDILQNSSVLMIKYCMFARINSIPSASFMNNGLLCFSASFFLGHFYQDDIGVCFCSLSMYSFSRQLFAHFALKTILSSVFPCQNALKT